LSLNPYFSGAGLDRADPLRADSNLLLELSGRADARQLVWRDGVPAIGSDGRLEWERVTEPALFLGLMGDVPCFSACHSSGDKLPPPPTQLSTLDREEAPVLAAALSLAAWHSRHRFCANCGAPTEPVRGGWSRRCATCSAEHFPRVDPVVIVLAEHENCLLLGRQPQYPPGRYSALAGFVEVGETVEAAVARELHEEAGVHVEQVTYLASQPWPFPSALMIGCSAKVLNRSLTIDTTELEDARWFTRREVASALAEKDDASFQAPPPWAIARTLLEHWLAA
jgi:NAD+ diphosphatase